MLTQVLHQLRYDTKIFLRNPAAVFFTIVLPLVFFAIFVAIFGNQTVDLPDGRKIGTSTYYVPSLTVVALTASAFTSVAIGLTEQREAGRLKRLRATALPVSVFLASRVLLATIIAFVMAGVLLFSGALFADVALPGTSIIGFLLALLVGSMCFSALGIAASSLIPTEEAAPPITNVLTLPLYFMSGLFIPVTQLPHWVLHVASFFPVKNLNDIFLKTIDPATHGVGLSLSHLLVVALWGGGAVVFAARRFSWVPRSERS